VDGTPMPSFADVIQPNDAWDLVHFLRTLQVHRHSKENEVSKGTSVKAPAATPDKEKPSGN
jgi:mono/diheme cytochrome c family protein